MKYTQQILVLCLVCFWGLNLKAAFTVSANNVIQTGTDNDLSSLDQAGVSVINQNGIMVYDIGNRIFIVRGNLTIDPEKESLIIGSFSGEQMIVDNSGHLTIGLQITNNGYTRYSNGTAIFLRDTSPGFVDRVSFRGNSTLTWNGGLISIFAGKFGFYGDAVTVNINSENATLIYRTESPQNQIRQETDNFISQAFTFINGDLTIVGTGQELNGYSPIHATGAIAFSGATPNVDVILRSYSGGDQGNLDIKLWSGGRPVLINSATGSELRAGPHISGNGTSYGVALIYQELMINYKDQFGQGIEGANYIFTDYNGGNQEVYNREGHLVDNQQIFEYSQASNNMGETSIEPILLAANIVNTGNGDAINTGNYAWDYRGKNGDNSDLFDLHHWAYGYEYLPSENIELKSTEAINLSFVLLEDRNITSATFANAQSISGISISHNASDNTGVININGNVDLCDLYDFIKSDKINNLSEPDFQSMIVNAVEDSLFIENYTLNFGPAGVLSACDKFVRLVSNTTTNFSDVSNNLQISYQDTNQNYKLIRLLGLDVNDVVIIDNNTDSNVFTSNNASGELAFVTQSNSNDITVLASKPGFNNWAVDVDLTTGDVFEFTVYNSATVGDPCSLSNQELELYLLRKILAKKEAVVNKLSIQDNVDISLNQIIASSTNPCLEEKQDEMLFLLKKIIAKSERIIGHLED